MCLLCWVGLGLREGTRGCGEAVRESWEQLARSRAASGRDRWKGCSLWLHEEGWLVRNLDKTEEQS